MPASPNDNIPPWIANRILDFFNKAQSIAEIDRVVLDNPEEGKDTAIGRTTAANILRQRNALPWNRFSTLQQLLEVKGLGAGKVNDLVYTFGVPADEAFQTAMYDEEVISRGNWDLVCYQVEIEDDRTFQKTVMDDRSFRRLVEEKLHEICKERGLTESDWVRMVEPVRSAYIDSYHNTTGAPAYALALWFYRFDADNWFSFDQVLRQTRKYFAYHPGYPWEMELRFFKGVRPMVFGPAVMVPDVPVVVNWPEKVVSVWLSALYD